MKRELQVQTDQQPLQTAFKVVSDALAMRSILNQRLAAQQALTDASQVCTR